MSNGDLIYVQALANRGLPNATTVDGQYGPIRNSRYGELITQPLYGAKMYPTSDEGSYFYASNPTPGTGIAGTAASTALSDLAPLMLIVNGSTTKELILDYIRLYVTAAGTNGTNFFVACKTDIGPSRYTSGGSTLTPVNPNQNSSSTSNATVKFGALVTTAATTSARLVGGSQVRTVIKVIGDTILLDFAASQRVAAGAPLEGTLQLERVIPMPPVILPPGGQFTLADWAASQSVAASYEVQAGWIER